MDLYRYQPLPSDLSRPIRLLQILPSKEEQAPMHCRLILFDLQDPEGLRIGNHLYEALSLNWGYSEETKTVSIESDSLFIEEGLHAALSRLRHRDIERLMWIDAICINHEDEEEVALQVQYMAEIYARASRVVAWLDEMTGDHQTDSKMRKENHQALHAIASAASGMSLQSGRSNDDYEMAMNLCLGAWFRRVWVLQEVTVARNVTFMCQSIEINSHALCLGVRAILDDRPPYSLPGIIHRIEAGTLRLEPAVNSSGEFTSQCHPLSDLLEVSRPHEALDCRDKVYALLGISSDAPPGLVPDYNISWADLFSQIVRSMLFKDVEVTTREDFPLALIRGKVSWVGEVTRLQLSDVWHNQLEITVQPFPQTSNKDREWTFHLPVTARPVMPGDIVCELRNAPHPLILRLHKDFCEIIWIAITAIHCNALWSRFATSIPPRKYYDPIFLTWNWDMKAAVGKAASRRFFLRQYLKEQGFSKRQPMYARDLYLLGTIYARLGRIDNAIEPFQMQIVKSAQVSKSVGFCSLDSMFWLSSLYNLRGGDGDDQLSAYWSIVLSSFDRGKDFEELNEIRRVELASMPDEGPVWFLLESQGEHTNVTEGVVAAAAANEKAGEGIMRVLLDFKGDTLPITDLVIKTATRNNQSGSKIMTLLLNHELQQLIITNDVLRESCIDVRLLLLGWEGRPFTIAYDIATVIVSLYEIHFDNKSFDARQLLTLFVKRHAGPIVVDIGFIHIIADLESQGAEYPWDHRHSSLCYDILDTLLGWEGDEITITEDASRTAKDCFPSFWDVDMADAT
ncbi:hypothetical protein PFICI_03616 [Pestalotiopsis fici W106-1]|uniref:Heterokaryon incompatibility domain-containing protein n=1 Tax=Pestalotiopsis fici (strain W106-1 / CGMCC3.15140) TaxID=1229662 RepID=W3XK23_PESFW|nr:uncharacterized protein PFICI_03616 [Pestalotiopsis fici W106-1]ETS85591.1 hypothetical protein PFICI_03616 [Pestalotiopsis fici W106-1]